MKLLNSEDNKNVLEIMIEKYRLNSKGSTINLTDNFSTEKKKAAMKTEIILSEKK